MENKANILIPKYNLDYRINKNKNIIQASLEMGIKLAFSCRSGVCGTCKAKILDGKVDISKAITHNLSSEERKNNIVYTCQASAKSDKLALEFLSPLSKNLYSNDRKPREFVLEVLSKKMFENTNIQLLTTFPKNNYTFIHDGMKVKIILEGKISKNKYYISSPLLKEDGSNNGILTIYIPIAEKNIYKNVVPGQILTISGPYLIENNSKIEDKPLLFLTPNKDIIAFLSNVKKILFNKNDQFVMLISSFDLAKNIQFMDEMHKIQNKYENFNFKIILIKEKANSNTRFIYGTVESNISKIISNLSNHIIYVSKNIDNYNKIIKRLNELGAIKKNILTLI